MRRRGERRRHRLEAHALQPSLELQPSRWREAGHQPPDPRATPRSMPSMMMLITVMLLGKRYDSHSQSWMKPTKAAISNSR